MTRKRQILFFLILIGYCAYAGAFIYRTSFVVDGERYFTLLDDAMISMRYAKNLASGYGLTWNPGGERVEGYTNPLWVLYMAAIHLLPVPDSKVSLIIQITGMICLLINLIYVKRICDEVARGESLAIVTAVFLTAFYYPLIYFSLRGMEVCLCTLVISYSIWRTYVSVHSGRSAYPVFAALGVGTFVRPDMVVVFAAVLCYFLIIRHEHRSRNLIAGLGTLLCCVIAQTGLRLAYYGELFPNTYYLKMTGLPVLWRLSRGLLGSVKFLAALYPLAFVVPFAYLVLLSSRQAWLLAWVIFMQMMYSTYVGGDAFDNITGTNRFFVVAMPLLFVLCGCCLVELKAVLCKAGTSHLPGFRLVFRLSAVVMVLSWLATFNLGYGTTSLRQWLLIDKPQVVELDQDKVEKALMLKKITSPDASIAVVWAGAIPYFSNLHAVDLLGKNDKKLAREPMQFIPPGGPRLLYEYRGFWPGHSKWNYSYSIGRLRPDIVVQLWHKEEDAKPLLDEYYLKQSTPQGEMYFLKDSKKVAWDKLNAAAER